MNALIVLGLAALAGFVSATARNEANVNIYLHLSDDEDPNYANTMHYAQCEMEPNAFMPSTLHHRVHGSIEMHQRGDGPLEMEFHLTGFNVSEDFADHNHGLQIHEYGDMEHGCDTIGELYHNEHAPNHAREPGDLGDLHDDDHGEVNATRTFDWLTIGHNDGILGRSLAILQGDHTTHTAIIACCVIGRSHAH